MFFTLVVSLVFLVLLAHSEDIEIEFWISSFLPALHIFYSFVVCLLFYKFCFLMRCDGKFDFPELSCYLCWVFLVLFVLLVLSVLNFGSFLPALQIFFTLSLSVFYFKSFFSFLWFAVMGTLSFRSAHSNDNVIVFWISFFFSSCSPEFCPLCCLCSVFILLFVQLLCCDGNFKFPECT